MLITNQISEYGSGYYLRSKGPPMAFKVQPAYLADAKAESINCTEAEAESKLENFAGSCPECTRNIIKRWSPHPNNSTIQVCITCYHRIMNTNRTKRLLAEGVTCATGKKCTAINSTTFKRNPLNRSTYLCDTCYRRVHKSIQKGEIAKEKIVKKETKNNFAEKRKAEVTPSTPKSPKPPKTAKTTPNAPSVHVDGRQTSTPLETSKQEVDQAMPKESNEKKLALPLLEKNPLSEFAKPNQPPTSPMPILATTLAQDTQPQDANEKKLAPPIPNILPPQVAATPHDWTAPIHLLSHTFSIPASPNWNAEQDLAEEGGPYVCNFVDTLEVGMST